MSAPLITTRVLRNGEKHVMHVWCATPGWWIAKSESHDTLHGSGVGPEQAADELAGKLEDVCAREAARLESTK